MKSRIILAMPLVFFLIMVNEAETQNVFFPERLEKGHPKIESHLIQVFEEHAKEGIAVSKGFAKDRGIKLDEEGMITVFLLPEVGKTKEAIDVEALKSYGGEVIKSGDYIIKARIPISMLTDIADNVKGISFIRLPDNPHANITSEGVNLTGTSSYYSAGYHGQNVKVAIVDLGFAGLSAAIASGELPNSVVKIDCTGTSCVPTTFPSEVENHGTAVAEIVYDMAPDAQLYLIKAIDQVDLKQAKDYGKSNAIKVINHSVGWVNQNFYDGSCYNDNPVCTVNDAFNNGILWVNSAGNFAGKHYAAVFSDPDGNSFHDISSGGECIDIQASEGNVIEVFLTWDSWPITNQDYDLYLYYNGTFGLEEVASSTTLQVGSAPTESITYNVPWTFWGTYCLAIKKYYATSNHRLKIFSFNHELSPYVPSGSLGSPADAASVMSVGAIDYPYWTTGPIADYSSQGPTSDGRIKPDISGPAAVSTYTSGAFSGTSAASPHVAGAAALILSNNPSYSVTQLWNALTSSAIGMGSGNIYGWGRLNLPQPTPVLSVSLSANPSSGLAPLNGVDLTVGVSGTATGTINYTFYCNRSDSGTDITYPYDYKIDGTSQTTFMAVDTCNYSTAGTYTAKVIAERGSLQAENRFTVTVNPSGDTTAPPAPINLAATPAIWTNVNSFSIDWTNPSDPSGIATGAYYKLGSLPTSNSDYYAFLNAITG